MKGFLAAALSASSHDKDAVEPPDPLRLFL